MPVFANSLSGLHQMFYLREVYIGVAVVYKGIEKLHRFPDTHLALLKAQVFALLFLHEVEGLIPVVQAIELLDRTAGLRRIVTELLFVHLRERAVSFFRV